MKPTIKDVAKYAGVSVATVSLVIHNHKRISPETQAKVNKAIKHLNYYPSRSARGLVQKKTGNIGFIITDEHFIRTEPFYTKIFLGTEFQAHKHDYYVLLTSVDKQFGENSVLPRFVLERNIDGIIIAGKVPQGLINALNAYKFPIVYVDFYPPEGDHSAVMIDNVRGGEMATSHLIELGHKKIGFIGGDIQHPSIKERFHGYKSALESAGIKFDSKLASIKWEEPVRNDGYAAAKELIKKINDITAIFACNDAMAIGAIHYLKEVGKNVPKDISVIGFDDVEADLMIEPPLSTIRVPKVEIGAEALQLVVDLVENKKASTKKVLVPIELIERASTKKIKKTRK